MQIANQFRTDILAGKYAQGRISSIHLIFGAGMLLEIGLHFFYPKGIHSSTGGYCGRYCTGSDRRSDTVWTYEAVL